MADKKETHKEILDNILTNKNTYYVCFACAKKHRQKEPYPYPMTLHTGNCALCGEYTAVGSSSKLFGMYRSV